MRTHRPVAVVLALLACATTACAASPGPRVAKRDFRIGVSVSPGDWIVDQEADMDRLSKICDTLFMATERYTSFQKSRLAPALDAAHKRGLKVILLYYRIEDGNTSLEQTARDFGNHPAVIGFKVKDELGAQGESPEYWVDFLTKARAAIRKSCQKPIMVDVIPWEFWHPGNKEWARRFPAATHAAIDTYVDKGLVDWLLISGEEKYPTGTNPAILARAVPRWGDKVKLLIRTSASFKGETYNLDAGSDPAKVRQRAVDAYENGAVGIHYYTWKHQAYRILNADGSSNPLYEGMVKLYKEFRH